MGGGEGAKERRRLKRLQETGDATTSSSATATDVEAKKKKDSSTHMTTSRLGTRKYADNNHKGDHRLATKTSPFSKGPSIIKGKNKNVLKKNHNGEQSQKKTKPKKPKHLKRKLEQVAEDDQIRERVKQELEEWERKKELHKRQRTMNSQTESSGIHHSDRKERPVAKNEDSKYHLGPKNNTPTQKNQGKSSQKPAVEDRSQNSPNLSEERNMKVLIPPSADANENQDSQHKQLKVSLKTDEKKNGENPSDTHSVSDDDLDNEEDTVHRRQRGRRRRGRKDTAKAIEEMEKTESEKKEKPTDQPKLANDAKVPASSMASEKANGEACSEKSANKRYCIGRKPVTDFVLGQSYEGTVVYVKSFGVFFDIGCHSDAFCHVSRLCDDYVESPESLFKEGDQVLNIRVVEIDRKNKRITVSLQSEARRQDELASMEARKQRKQSRKSKQGKKHQPSGPAEETGSNIDSEFPSTKKNSSCATNNDASCNLPVKKKSSSAFAPADSTKDTSMMSPAELKRMRKLARRAARRNDNTEDVERQ
jgi:predicted RNA-binding protein with RPS1 domain